MQVSTLKRKSPISSVPQEILFHIFGLLDTNSKQSAAQVCRVWRDVIYSKSLWKDVKVLLDEIEDVFSSSPELFDSFRARGITSVHVLHADLIPETLQLLDDKIGLKKIDFVINGLDMLKPRKRSKLLKQFYLSSKKRGKCYNIEFLSLYKDSDTIDIPAEVCTKLVDIIPNIRELEITGCSNVTNECLYTMARSLHRLENLYIEGSDHVTDLGISFLCGTNTCQERKGTGLPHLKEFQLLSCPLITDKSAEHIAQGLTELQVLHLRKCFQISQSSLAHLPNLKHLVELAVEELEIYDSGLKHIAKIASLQKLRLFNLLGLSDNAVQILGAGDFHLQELSLDGGNLDDNAMKHFATGFEALTDLDLTSNWIGDTGLEHVCRLLPQLESLWLISCSDITDAGILLVPRYLKALKQIHISYCYCVTAKAIDVLKSFKIDVKKYH